MSFMFLRNFNTIRTKLLSLNCGSIKPFASYLSMVPVQVVSDRYRHRLCIWCVQIRTVVSQKIRNYLFFCMAQEGKNICFLLEFLMNPQFQMAMKIMQRIVLKLYCRQCLWFFLAFPQNAILDSYLIFAEPWWCSGISTF